MGCGQKSFKLVWRCLQLLSGFLAKGHFGANNTGDNEMIPGAVHRSAGICVNAEKNLGKPQLGDHLMKWLCDQFMLKEESSFVLHAIKVIRDIKNLLQNCTFSKINIIKLYYIQIINKIIIKYLIVSFTV